MVKDKTFTFSYQYPDRMRLEGELEGKAAIIVRDGNHLWMQVPSSHLILDGSAEVPRFSTRPDSVEAVHLEKLIPSLPKEQLPLLPALTIMKLSMAADGQEWLKMRLTPEAVTALKAPAGEVQLRLGGGNRKPDQVAYVDGDQRVVMEIVSFESGDAVSSTLWTPQPKADDKVEKVAASHLAKFLGVLMQSLTAKIPTLPVVDMVSLKREVPAIK